ncbi:unnamed protein product [Thlaspi arvense]|uniref:DUF220 domain-containing protein n=1 Tax=Thlaspi arvense TaxID=13288 RepID=A0AAU9R944_THLAR|nr:unnamed protein product [Thlaspi arvense]
MGVFPGFGVWINQKSQQPPKAESKRSENVESKSVSQDTNNAPTKEKNAYYDKDHEKQQDQLWHDAQKKHPWYDAPPKVKVTTKNGICHMNIEMIVGLTPDGVYELFTNPETGAFFDKDKWRDLIEMGGFPEFGVWINQNTQQPLKAESKRSENVNKSESVSEKGNTNQDLYFDKDEELKQGKLWRIAEKKHRWYDAPPRVKVTTKDGICHMKIELTMGLPPETVYELFTNPNNGPFFDMDKFGRQLLKNKSRKVFKKDGPREIAETEKTLAWEFLWWSGALPINLTVDENKKDLTTKYMKEKMMFMKVFEGSYKVEPIYVDSERLSMSVFPGFGSWINQNTQQPSKAESKSPDESNNVWAVDPKYYDLAEVRKESKLWRAAEKKHPWSDAPARIKENKSTKVLKKDGPRQTTEVEKALTWNFLWWSGDIPIHLIIEENHKNLTAKYKANKLMLMKVLEGSWKVEPDYVDQELLCKARLPKSREEYKRCSGGQGKVGSKVTMEQRFQPSSLLSLPPVSWFIRGITIKTTKTLLEDLRKAGATYRRI